MSSMPSEPELFSNAQLDEMRWQLADAAIEEGLTALAEGDEEGARRAGYAALELQQAPVGRFVECLRSLRFKEGE